MSQFLPGTIRYGREDFPDISPFTLRSARSYEDILSAVRVYLRDVVNPYIEEDSARAVWDANAAALTQGVDNRIDEAILAMAEGTVPVTDATIAAVLDAATSGTKTRLDGRYQQIPTVYGHRLLTGAGIDLTGATPSDAGVQAFLNACADGDTVVVPSGTVLTFTTGFTISKRIRLTGTGELRYTGADGGNLIQVSHDGVHLDGLYATNPNNMQKSCVNVSANIFRATGNLFTGWRDGIKIAAEGEWHDVVIANNQILDVIGGTANNGESNGDGIVSWGAAVTIVGNRVTCKAGADARIGIHVEALPDRITTPYKHSDALAVIANNVVTGQFRRSITTEGVQHAVITGNTIADPTCWGINVVGLAHFSIVANNTIKWTRTAADVQAAFLNTQRSGIYIYCIQEALKSLQVTGNTIRAVAGATIHGGITLATDASVAANAAIGLKVVNNQIVDESATMQYGINIGAVTTASEIAGNRIPAVTKVGIRLVQAADVSVYDNRVVGPGAGANIFGILLEGGATDANVSNNRCVAFASGISAQFRHGTLKLNSNTIKDCTTGIDAYSSDAAGICTGNIYSGVTTKTSNFGASIVMGTNN